jgi:hypothetical protein
MFKMNTFHTIRGTQAAIRHNTVIDCAVMIDAQAMPDAAMTDLDRVVGKTGAFLLVWQVPRSGRSC